MPFRPCYTRVGPLPEPELCCCCVGRRSRSAVAPAPPDPACLPAARRPAAAGHRLGSAARPATPAARPGMTHRDERNVHRWTNHPYRRLRAAGCCACDAGGRVQIFHSGLRSGLLGFLVRSSWCRSARSRAARPVPGMGGRRSGLCLTPGRHARDGWFRPRKLTGADGFVPERTMMAPPSADPGTAEALTSRTLGQ
jgi:hypothetical protein